MGHTYVTASASIIVGQETKITSVVCTPTTLSSGVTILYNATAATANTEVLKIQAPTDGSSAFWHDSNGINVSNLYAAVSSAFATIVWD